MKRLSLNSVLNKDIFYLNNYSPQPQLKVVKIWYKVDVSKNLCVESTNFLKEERNSKKPFD